MIRNPHELRAFQSSDALIVDMYRETAGMPMEERFGLQAQIRRAAISVPTNLVEGCARPTTPEYCRFVYIARSSSCEVEYLLGLAARLGFMNARAADQLARRYRGVQAGLYRLVASLECPSSTREP
jgi:four helix bundle protein